MLSKTLRSLSATSSSTTYTIVALSYRGFWASSGRPSEAGIKLDASAAVTWVAENFSSNMNGGDGDVSLVLWGQSLGAGVAVEAAAANAITKLDSNNSKEGTEIEGLLLETPFVSVEAMLLELYPQKWLPYRYLSPFLRNHWDSKEALGRLAGSCESRQKLVGAYGSRPLKLLILQAGKDEIVPPTQGLELEACARDMGFDARRIEVKAALHNEVSMKASGRAAIVGFLKEIGDADRGHKKR